MANSTSGYGNYTSQMNQTRTESWPEGVLVFLSALNIFLSVTATLGNTLILLALHKESSLHPPTKLLFRCLAVTDLCAGLISQPLFAVAVMARIVKINYLDEIDEGYIVTAFTLCGISILTLTTISVDRLLAILLGLRYRHVVSLRRTPAVTSLFLCNKCFKWINAFLEYSYFLGCSYCICCTLSCYYNLLLHKDLLHITTTSISSTKPCFPRPTESRKNATEHWTIQKDCF